MIVQCKECKMWFEDVYRSTLCPHVAFPANDGANNFKVHDDAYLSDAAPKGYSKKWVMAGTHTLKEKDSDAEAT